MFGEYPGLENKYQKFLKLITGGHFWHICGGGQFVVWTWGGVVYIWNGEHIGHVGQVWALGQGHRDIIFE